MKTKLFTAAVLFGSFGLALTNCGGDGGGGNPRPFLNLNPDQITFINPAEGQITPNFCRYGDYKIEVEGDACDEYADNPNEWLELRRSGDTTGSAIPLTKGVATQADGTCILEGIRPTTALVEGVEHTLAFANAPSGSSGIERKFVKFVTSLRSQDAQVCGNSSFQATGISPGDSLSSSTIDTFGTQDSEGNWIFDWDGFADTLAATNLATAIGSIFGFTTPSDTTFIVEFNENLDPLFVPNSVALYRLNAISGSCLGVTGLEERISLNSGCTGQSSCLAVSNNVLQVKLPDFGGGVGSGCYALIFARGMKSQLGKYLDKTYYKAYVIQ